MGLVGALLIAGSAGVVVATRGSRDRSVHALAWYLALSTVASLVVHWTVHGASRVAPLMWLDVALLYALGLMAVCRFDRPAWLYGLAAATAMECAAHLAYVAGWIRGNEHILALNLGVTAQAACLLIGRDSEPELDPRKALQDELDRADSRPGGSAFGLPAGPRLAAG